MVLPLNDLATDGTPSKPERIARSTTRHFPRCSPGRRVARDNEGPKLEVRKEIERASGPTARQSEDWSHWRSPDLAQMDPIVPGHRTAESLTPNRSGVGGPSRPDPPE